MVALICAVFEAVVVFWVSPNQELPVFGHLFTVIMPLEPAPETLRFAVFRL